MAFEIYNGTGNGIAMFTKLNEMWEFDSYDDTDGIIATYGNAKFEIPGAALRIYNSTTQIFNQEAFSSNALFTIVKSESSIMLSWIYVDNYIHTIIIGTLANIDGTNTGKGVVFTSGSSSNYYMIAGTNGDVSVSGSYYSTDTLTQLVPQVSMREGWIFNNAYRSLYDTSDNKRGLYMIGNQRYYISGRAAIKEE